jgi:hypothetical protein
MVAISEIVISKRAIGLIPVKTVQSSALFLPSDHRLEAAFSIFPAGGVSRSFVDLTMRQTSQKTPKKHD